MELRRKVEKRLELARRQQEATEAGPEWAYLHGYTRACGHILEDITDLGIREFEAKAGVMARLEASEDYEDGHPMNEGDV